MRREMAMPWVLVEELRRLVKFGCAGGSGYLVHLGVLAGLTDGLGLFYMLSAVAASAINISWNFTINEIWTFKDRHEGRVLVRYAKYFGLTITTGLIYFGLLWAFTEWLGIWYLASAIMALGVQVMVNFAFCFRWVWK